MVRKMEFGVATPNVMNMQVAPVENANPLTIMELDTIGKPNTQAIARVTDEITKVTRGADLDEVGKLLGDLLVKAQDLDPKKLGKPGLFGLFKRKVQQVSNRFTSVSTQLEQMTKEVDGKIVHFRQRIGSLEQLYTQTRDFHDGLGQVIAEMEKRISWMESNVPAIDPNDVFSAQEQQKWMQTIEFAKKRADDLRRVQVLAQQQGPMIQMMIVNSAALAQKFDDVKTTTLPAWKNLFSIYILQLEQKKGAELALEIDDATSRAIRAGADMLNQTTTMVHTALNQSAIKIEDLDYNQQKLLESIETAKRLAEEGRQRRASERSQVEQLSQSLAQLEFKGN